MVRGGAVFAGIRCLLLVSIEISTMVCMCPLKQGGSCGMGWESGSEAGPLLVVVAYSHSALSVGLRTTPSYSV